MKKRLKHILKTLTQTNSDNNLVISFKFACQLVLTGNDIFHKVPTSVSVPISYFEVGRETVVEQVADNLKTIFSKPDIDTFITYSQYNGVLLYDGIYASAFGKMKYIYRSKGIRIYLFKDESIKVYSTYCTIDHNGLDYSLEEFFSYNISNLSYDSLIELLQSMDCNKINLIPTKIVEIITNIKKTFNPAYFIEYILNPPDVNIISNFSQEIRTQLWDICLSPNFKQEVDDKGLDISIKILTSLGISPNLKQVSKYLSQYSNKDEMMSAIARIEKNTSKIDPVFKSRLNLGILVIDISALIARINNSKHPRLYKFLFVLFLLIIITVVFNN